MFKSLIRQCYFICIWVINLLLLLLPFSIARVALLKAIGQRVAWSASLQRGVRILSLKPNTLRIRERVIVNHSVLLDNRGGLVLMADVAVSSGTAIFSYGHDHQQIFRPTRAKPTVVGPGVFIYSRAIICPGAHLRGHCVVAPGSVVTKPTSRQAFWGGNPARCIRPQYAVKGRNESYQYVLAP
ncbi:acyltransferase [Novosphingobium album (ex Hu et al. 2023)]|uniref:Acyltransferase n=1 Tax=Novosphingobium album (ex Hu et al. 2023) TaxID=2930093 RepID=A0ABT0B5T9_9SPHN|nr:hypothetical protein [Novosphingobium album (ex Hu et al. 2023)]MCJ2180442.1 hypothetical protein [Novosphingobium album (ex Hu et al. 2023)]